MNPEILKPQEKNKTIISEHKNSPPTVLDENQIEATITQRKELLESIKNQISLKSYYALEEKINAEKEKLDEILDWRVGKQSRIAKFTFILDPRFFEQEFIN